MRHRDPSFFALLVTLLVAACGSSNSSPGPSGSNGDGGAPDGTPASSSSSSSGGGGDGGDAGNGACAASRQSCVSTPCCSGYCLNGLRINGQNGTLCVDANVDYGATCAPAPCGGDATGTWTTLVSACGQAACGTPGAGGIALNTPVVIGQPGGVGMDVVYRLMACGWVDEAGSDGLDGTLQGASTDSGPTIPYCVQGSTLWLFPNKSFGHTTLTALKLTR